MIVTTTERDPQRQNIAIQQLYAGRSNAVGLVTLKSGAASTTVNPKDATNPGALNVGPNSKIFLFPTTAHAAAELAAGGCYIPTATVTKQQFVIQHANNAQTDRTFFYVSLG